MMLALLLACSKTSALTLTVLVDQSALRQIPDYPAEVLIDFASGEKIVGIEICTWNNTDFLETELPREIYKGCRSATTVRGVLVPLEDDACDDGQINTARDALPDDSTWVGFGERVVFDGDNCTYIEDATLAIDGL